jgi:hypothetical protein
MTDQMTDTTLWQLTKFIWKLMAAVTIAAVPIAAVIGVIAVIAKN